MAYASILDKRANDRAYYLLNKDKIKKRSRRWRKENIERATLYNKRYKELHRARLAKHRRAYYLTHREAKIAYSCSWAIKNKERRAEYIKAYSRKNRVKRNARFKSLDADSPERIASNLRTRLGQAVKSNAKYGSAVRDLGCSISELRAHIENLWQPGMTWQNWGRKGWHIDHRIPFSSIKINDKKQLLRVLHYSNLQPLWWIENLKKGKRLSKSC